MMRMYTATTMTMSTAQAPMTAAGMAATNNMYVCIKDQIQHPAFLPLYHEIYRSYFDTLKKSAAP